MTGNSGESAPGSPGGAIFLFETTHDAIQAEEAIIDAGYWCDVVPRPPATSSTLCGLAIEVQPADSSGIASLLKDLGISFEIYQPVKP